MGYFHRSVIKKMTLRYQMLLGGILILLVPMILVGIITFTKSSRTLEDISKLQLVQIAESLSGMIRIPLEKDLRILVEVAGDSRTVQDALTGDYRVTKEELAVLYQVLTSDYYEDFAVFDEAGTIQGVGSGEDRVGISISDRGYYQAALKGEASVGTVVISKATQAPIFVLCAPIMSPNGRFIGGIMGVVKAEYLMRYISSVKLGATGYAFMINQEGNVIAHPDQAIILNTDLGPNSELAGITKKMIQSHSGTAEYTYRGIQKVAGFTSVELAGWSIAVSQNKEEIMALAYENRKLILLVTVVFGLLTILAVFFFSGTISTPVQSKLTTLDQAIEQAGEAFVIVGLDGEVQVANPAMAAIVGRPIRNIIGRPLDLHNTRQVGEGDLRRTLKAGNIWSGHIIRKKKNGSDLTADFTITPVRTATGKLNGYLGIGRDISKELMMQERVQQSQKMEAIGTLAGGIAHDFNNILTAVFGYTELALANLDDPARVEDYLTEVLNASKRARDLVGHILAFSRKTDPGQKPIIPKYIIKEALELLRASLPSTIEIRSSLTSSAAILGNPTQIHQMTMNLCTNAGYEMKQKGGVLTVSLDELIVNQDSTIHHPGVKPGAYLVLKVTDSGCGIPVDIQERIFDPFFTTKPTGEGTGLGLSVVHGIVQSLNGFATVTSEMGKGSVFSVYLPIVEVDVEGDEINVQEQLPRGTERLLFVDDEEPIIQSGKYILQSLGYDVVTFTQSTSAWETFAKDPDAFDAVITDYTMPRMTGVDLAMKIMEIRPDIPIIISSGDISFQENADGLGIFEFVKKPVTSRELSLVVRRVLDRRRE